MKALRRSVLLGFILAIAVNLGHSTELVIQQEPSLSRTLAGHAFVWGSNEPLSGVSVELCNSDWKAVLSTTKTDKNGYFSLEKPVTGRLFYIRLSAPGMNPYQLRVRIKMQAASELTIHLSVAT
jgi:hypothetical protein